MALSLIIGSTQEYINYIYDFRTVVVEDSIQVASDTMEFSLIIYNAEISEPQAGNEVTFYDGATKEFAGVIIEVIREYSPEALGILYHCSCRDYVWHLNKRKVNNLYDLSRTNQKLGLSEVVLYAGNVIKTILIDLAQDSNNDKYYHAFDNDFSNIQLGPEINQQIFNKLPASQCFDTIAQGVGYIWWLDFDKVVHFVSITTENSPLVANTLNVDTDLDTYYDLEDTENIEDISTELLLVDVVNRSGSTITLEFTGSDGRKHGANDFKIFDLEPQPFSYANITSITINKNGGGDIEQDKQPEDIAGTIEGGEGTSTDVFAKVADAGSYIRLSNANNVDADDVIKVTYFYAFVTEGLGLATSAFISDIQGRTGGDGIHQFVFAQASGLKVQNAAQLQATIDIILGRKARVLLRGQFKSWVKGWKAGQNFIRSWTQLSLSDTVYVVTVEKRILTPANDPNLADNVIETQVTYSNLPYGVNL